MADIEVRLDRLFFLLPSIRRLTCLVQERLRSHSDAFSGLMSLIPAKYYYEEDHSVSAVVVCRRVLSS